MRRVSGILLASSVVIVGFVAACSSDDAGTSGKSSSSGSSGTSGTSGDGGASSSSGGAVTPSAYAKELCARYERCTPGDNVAGYGDAKTCESNEEKGISASRTAKGTGMTETALAACAATLKTASCDLSVEAIPECAFKGTVADNGGCSDNVQCASGACFFAKEGDCGKCMKPGGVDADCQVAGCAVGLFCTKANKCAKLAAAGADCSVATGGPCEGNLACISSKCATRIAKGAACTEPASDQDGDPCVRGTSCTDGKCAAEPAPTAKAGEKCGPTIGCVNGYCGDRDTCVGYAVEGGACEGEDDCQSPMDCVSAKCAFVKTAPTCN